MDYYEECSNDSQCSGSRLMLVPTSQANKATTGSITAERRARSTKSTSKETRKTYVSMIGDADFICDRLKDHIDEAFVLYTEKHIAPEKYTYVPIFSDSISNIISWARFDICESIPDLISWNSFPCLEPFQLLCLSNEVFLECIIQASNDFEFPQLAITINQMFPTSESDSHASSRIVALVDLDKDCVKFQKKLSKSGRPNRNVGDLVDSAVSYLLFELDMEVVRFKRSAELCEYLGTLTRLVAERNGDSQVVTEIDCVAKAQRDKVPEGLSAQEAEQFELRQTWSAMLQMLPLMSKDKAQALLQRPECSCPRALLDAFHNSADPAVRALPVTEKKLLLQGHFGAGKNGAVRNQAKLSKLLYNLVTSMEPADLIDNV